MQALVESSSGVRRGTTKKTVLIIASRHVGWVFVRQALDDQSALRVIADVSNADAAVRQAAARQPDLILVAGDLHDCSLPDLVKRLTTCSRQSHIVLFGDGPDGRITATLEANGGLSYVLWRTVTEENLPSGLLTVAGGYQIFSQDVLGTRLRPVGGSPVSEAPPLDPREGKILESILAGHSQVQIAEELKIGRRTVQKDIEKLKKAFVAGTVAEMIRAATLLGFGR